MIEKTIATQPPNCRIVVCDDGSDDDTYYVVSKFDNVVYVRGSNKGVAYNKNRAMFTLQDCAFVAMLEDDLIPENPLWFERYEDASILTGIHHFCRVQDKELGDTVPGFTEWLTSKKITPIFGPSPRGDMTFYTNKVVRKVGGFNPKFFGIGYAHGEWSHRVQQCGLIPHPLKWVDIEESRDSFVQKGDQEGGRWHISEAEIKEQIKRNRAIQRKLKASRYTYCPLSLG